MSYEVVVHSDNIHDYCKKFFNSLTEHIYMTRKVFSRFGSGGNCYDIEIPKDNSLSEAKLNGAYYMTLLIYSGLCELLEKELSIFEYISIIGSLKSTFGDRDFDVGITSKYIISLGIDQELIPSELKKEIVFEDEEAVANSLIMQECKNIQDPDGTMAFEQYYEYVSGFAQTILDKLHSNGLFGTHNVDMFSNIIILHLLGVPQIIPVYSVKGFSQIDDNGSLAHIVSEMYNRLFGYRC